ncbi:element excision factor XisH family protein [Cyanobacterium aponinum AL20118]|uniref:Element excision factor XisH family protein n=1 Tax=Cyanobacterium aponinum AL20115 TaxID=3090662 RepID=A0AAF1C1P6_9CHRO|nr:element excision factor XisH family protein [Cyanobacterium aponinum]WPF88867.1 element excision factor XisH family protein [Cyanobacterium aponinum AL20115]
MVMVEGSIRGKEKIAIEIKNFRSKSPIVDLEGAIGQYVLYQLLLQQIEPERVIYLAITQEMKNEIFSEPLYDGIERGITEELINLGIVEEDIVLAFQDLEKELILS